MAQKQSGLTRRLSKLKRGKIYSILAIDHGLTSGLVQGLEDTSRWSEFADAVGIAAVVANIGAAREMPENRRHALILQTMGSPSILGKKASRRVVNTSVEEALYFDADCVAVQIDFNSESLEENVSEISLVRMQAHKLGMPVLFMISTPKGGFKDGKEVLDAVKACDELGADLIKTACACQKEYPEPIVSSLTGIAPVVLAGGEAGEQFLTKLHKAKELGFGGYCVGRNIFQSSDPRLVFEQIEKKFD